MSKYKVGDVVRIGVNAQEQYRGRHAVITRIRDAVSSRIRPYSGTSYSVKMLPITSNIELHATETSIDSIIDPHVAKLLYGEIEL